ncbi:MAG: hypothetical protein HYV96_14245 [Opitutae bacterium]|nr:hypothetical protein [Opitutae bacterium]
MIKKLLLRTLLLSALALIAHAAPNFQGLWRFDPTASTALDGWTAIDLAIRVDGSRVALEHRMTWRDTKLTKTNVFDTATPGELRDFFRIDQRHMAVYPAKDGVTRASAAWIDDGRTLRTEAIVPVEISQGETHLRVTTEYRVSEDGGTLTVIELHSTRNRPLIYVFRKVAA